MDTHLGKYHIGFISSKGIKGFKWILMLSQSAGVGNFKLNSQLEAESFLSFLMYRKKTLGIEVFYLTRLKSHFSFDFYR